MEREHRTELLLPLPLDKVFAFFADAANLEAITPPRLSFRILSSQPIEIEEGVTIDYRLRWRGFPLRWRTLISAWDPPHRFVDEQIRGPYALWVHTHTFEETPEGTRIRDHVRYKLPGSLLARPFAGLFANEIREIFAYRNATIPRLLLVPPESRVIS